MCGKFCIFANVNDKMTANMATDKTAYWLDIADYDLDTAEALHNSGRWLYVAFMCHQVIEKGGVRETTECLVEGTRSKPTGALPVTTTRPTRTTTSGWPTVADSTSN